jgi:hypothetical protein
VGTVSFVALLSGLIILSMGMDNFARRLHSWVQLFVVVDGRSLVCEVSSEVR